MESGICICGGGGLIKNIAERVTDEVNIRAYIADDPLTCVARGAVRVLEDYNNLRRLLVGLERGSTVH
jgi:rod shape-determining protein MreB